MTASGIWPGLVLADGKRVPPNVDALTLAAIQGFLPSIFQNFTGTLNASGQETAQVVVPNVAPLAGPVTINLTFVTTTSPTFTSTPVTITITP